MQMKRHKYRELVNDLRAVPNVQSKRELICRVLEVHGIFPEPIKMGKRILLRVLKVDLDGFAHVEGWSSTLKVYCQFPAVGPGWYYDGSFISPEQFAAMDPSEYHIKEHPDASSGLPEEISDAPAAG